MRLPTAGLAITASTAIPSPTPGRASRLQKRTTLSSPVRLSGVQWTEYYFLSSSVSDSFRPGISVDYDRFCYLVYVLGLRRLIMVMILYSQRSSPLPASDATGLWRCLSCLAPSRQHLHGDLSSRVQRRSGHGVVAQYIQERWLRSLLQELQELYVCIYRRHSALSVLIEQLRWTLPDCFSRESGLRTHRSSRGVHFTIKLMARHRRKPL